MGLFGEGVTTNTFYILPTIEIDTCFEYILFGWLWFGLEFHYDLLRKDKDDGI